MVDLPVKRIRPNHLKPSRATETVSEIVGQAHDPLRFRAYPVLEIGKRRAAVGGGSYCPRARQDCAPMRPNMLACSFVALWRWRKIPADSPFANRPSNRTAVVFLDDPAAPNALAKARHVAGE